MTLPPRSANRLFAAADLPVDARSRLAGSAAEVAAGSGGRPVAPESLHVTLDFIGRVDPPRWPVLAEAVAQALAGPPVRVGLGPLRARPRSSRARLVARELTDPEGALAEWILRVRAAVDAALERSPDGSAPWPHVTLVRLRRAVRVDLPPATDEEHMFDISRAALYDSHQSPGGPPRYRELFAVELRPAP
jgi:2'-5' RNA ligase